MRLCRATGKESSHESVPQEPAEFDRCVDVVPAGHAEPGSHGRAARELKERDRCRGSQLLQHVRDRRRRAEPEDPEGLGRRMRDTMAPVAVSGAPAENANAAPAVA